KSENMAEGEYRSHLSFHAIPEVAAEADIEAEAVKNGQVAVRLIPVYGVSIPVIVRHGDLKASAGISNVKLSGKTLTFTLTRSGGKSLYGDLVATDSEKKLVGEARG